MNIEIANRLQKLRKENGYSQEELADKLGISRQAVSKWERAESSPDTDNLIILARLYNMSLDELLYDNETNDEIRKRNIDKTEDSKKDENVISLTDDEGQTLRIENGHIRCYNKDGSEEKLNKKQLAIKGVYNGIILVLTLIGFFIWGFVFDGWHVCWILWVLMPALSSIITVIFSKKINDFLFPCLVTSIYLFLGMQYEYWHPHWIIFISIPVFYIIFEGIEKIKNANVEKKSED